MAVKKQIPTSAPRSSQKRAAIIDAARARFHHYGIRKTTMQEIAQDAGLAVGTLYLYFKNKDEVVVACAEEFAGLHRKESQKVLDSDAAPDEKLRRYVLSRYRACREVSTSSRHAAELAREVIRLHPSRLADDGQIMEQTIRACLDEGARTGQFQIADTTGDARVFLISIAYFFPNATQGLTQWPAEPMLKMVMDWFVRGWKAKKNG